MLRWIVRLLGVLVVAAVLLVGALFLLPADRIANIAADQLKKYTGRDVVLGGDVSLTVWPVLGAKVGSLSIGNPDWADEPVMLSATDASFGVDARALLGGDIRITHVAASSPVIRLEQRTDGRASWVFSEAATDTASNAQPVDAGSETSVSIQNVTITDASFLLTSQGSAPLSYDNVDLSLSWPDQAGAARIDATLSPAGQPVTIGADIAEFAGFLDGSISDITASVTANGALSFSGRAATNGDAAGRFTLKTDSTDGFLTALGLAALDLPQGAGRSLDLSTEVTFTNGNALALRDLRLGLGQGNQINGDVDLTLADVPNITANLSAGALNLASLGGDTGGSGAAATPAPSSGWSQEPIDASGLAAFNGQFNLSADSIDLGMLKLGQTQVSARNDQSRIVLDLRQISLYGGALAGEFVVNNRNGLSVGGTLNGTGFQVQNLLDDFAGVTRVTGTADTQIKFLGVGGSMDQIMRSLSGQGAFEIAEGTLQGFNLDQLMRTGQIKGGTTLFKSLTASYTMKDGNLSNSDLFADLQDFEARGEGRIGLGAQDIDYLFTPKALKANEGKGLAIPVRIRGPWADPKIQPDLEAALDLNLDAEKERLERELKAKRDAAEKEVKEKLKEAEAKAKEKLEDEVQSIEDKIESEVGNRLKKLFD